MLYVILFFEILFFMLILYKLSTTNHWTVGKKLLVALVSGILVEGIGFLLAMICTLDPMIMSLIKIPKILVSAIMVSIIYSKDGTIH